MSEINRVNYGPGKTQEVNESRDERKVAFTPSTKQFDVDQPCTSNDNRKAGGLDEVDLSIDRQTNSSWTALVKDEGGPGVPSMQDRALEFDDIDTTLPDKNKVGRQGWIIAFAAFLTNVVLIGTHNCFGLLFIDLVQEFNEPLFKTGN